MHVVCITTGYIYICRFADASGMYDSYNTMNMKEAGNSYVMIWDLVSFVI